jgi:uncharacterized protein (DUF1800 family)
MVGFRLALIYRCAASLVLCGFLVFLNGCTVVGNAAATAPLLTLAISGGSEVRAGATAQFSAALSNGANAAVTWQVNGLQGGSSVSGTISVSGLYTAPVGSPLPLSVTIGAISSDSAGTQGSLVESILNPVPIVTVATASQSSPGANILVDVVGSSFAPGAQIQVAGVNVVTTDVSATELQATIAPVTGSTTLAIDVLNPSPGAVASTIQSIPIATKYPSLAAASRLLDQTTFGPTLSDIQHVQQIGLGAYLTEQFNATPTLLLDVSTPTPTFCTATSTAPCVQSEWWQAALTGGDQLRQRVAFALSEMFVVSTNTLAGAAVVPYQNLLVKDAFGNFSTLLHDVTLSTGMGAYLNMMNSAVPGTGQIANENYAREGMQLFSIGLYQLNQDGTPQLDSSGNMIPTYTQAQVQAFARAYTGWTYATASGSSPTTFPERTPNYDSAMMPVESKHDETEKALLNGTVLSSGQSAENDLAGALANVFAHENAGPFICRQLIQHLVVSNPSPAYVARISAVFADNGSAVRGDLRAVIMALLLDPEARAGDLDPTAEGGHLREPVLYLTDVMRGLGYLNTDSNGYYGNLSNYSGNLSQSPFASGSVFNFFPPDYMIPGSTATSPEFSLENTASAMLRLSLANNLVYNKITGFNVDLSATSPLGLMASDAGNLVDALGVTFMHGQMPTEMRTAIVNHVATLADPAERVRVATYLVISSSLYKVEH